MQHPSSHNKHSFEEIQRRLLVGVHINIEHDNTCISKWNETGTFTLHTNNGGRNRNQRRAIMRKYEHKLCAPKETHTISKCTEFIEWNELQINCKFRTFIKSDEGAIYRGCSYNCIKRYFGITEIKCWNEDETKSIVKSNVRFISNKTNTRICERYWAIRRKQIW